MGDTLWAVNIALGLTDPNAIQALNLNIKDWNEIMAGSLYCIPYTS